MADTYLGNPNLKSANVPIQFDKEQVEEYIKCSENIIYFIRNYVKIVSLDHGLVPFDLYDFQEDMITTLDQNRFVISKIPRQSGKTTVIVSYLLHYILFNSNKNIAILANKGSLAREILSKLQNSYEYLPLWMQQGVVTWNKGNIELENGSRIIASSTSSSNVRGMSFNMIFLDEFAFVPFNVAEDFFTSVYPTISSGKDTKVIIVSTPNGMNKFYKMWKDAVEKKSDYVPFEVHWTDIPGRDENWKEQTIRNTSEEQFSQEFECEFIGSQATLINPNTIKNMSFRKPLYTKNGLDIFDDAKNDNFYIMGVDVGKGLEQDFSAITVWDATELPYKVVAKYRSNNISHMIFPNIIQQIGQRYNNAFCLIELNDVGQTVAEILRNEIEYENVVSVSIMGRAGQQINSGFSKNSQWGVRMSAQVKRYGCIHLKSLIENGQLIVEDFDIISELTTFIQNSTGSYAAEDGKHDDLVMTLVMLSWMVNQQYFKDLVTHDLRENMYGESIKQMEDELLPFGYINDGLGEQYEMDSDGEVWTSASW